MLKNKLFFTVAVVIGFVSAASAQDNAPRYLTPPKEIVQAFDAPLLPQAILSPSRQVLALLYRRPYPTIAELSPNGSS